jgi:DNA helicase II / ATP-dependent DNA helicase PcrA
MKIYYGSLRQASDNKLSIPQKLETVKQYYSPILKSIDPEYQIRLLDISVLIDLSGKYDCIDEFLTDFALDPPSKRFGKSTTPLINEGEDKPLTASTIYSVKGLEWYSVFIPHALDVLTPSVKALNMLSRIKASYQIIGINETITVCYNLM